MLAAVFAVLFGLSLLPGRKPLCLRFAERVSGGIMPDGAEAYCRRLTWLWFAVLAALSAANGALFACGVWWAGFATFAVVPLLLVAECIYRGRRFRAVFRTSGSTGRSKTVVKTFESLAKEVAMHRDFYARRFGAQEARGLVFIGTVAWDHMYGRLWMDMLPKALGAKADPDVVRTPEELLSKMSSAGRVVLVTTPTFLDRFAAYADQYDVPRTVVEIVTSGSLLTREVSDRAERVFGVAPRQIFGSTETGGVAWRRFGESPEDFGWELFPGVDACENADTRIRVWSPYSFEQGYVMGDGVEFSGARRFRLLGRLDRLVKINEERVNLAEMEERVCALGFGECALAKVSGRHGEFLGCVLAKPSPAAPRTPLELRRLLLPVFPKGTVPRRFRFVAELPRNEQGKVLAADVSRLLEVHEARLSFTGRETFFQGHFPGSPILPGVVQVSLAVEHARRLCGMEGPLRMVKKMKFAHVVEPGHEVVLRLERRGEREVAYEITEGDATCASGTLVF